MTARSAGRGLVIASSETSLDFLRSRLRLLGIALVCSKVALIPVIFDRESDVPFTVIKALSSHALAYVLAGVMVGLAVQYGRTVVVRSWLHIPVLAFLLANVVATVFAADSLLAFYGAHERMTGLGTIADGVLLYLGIAFLVRTPREALALAGSFLAGSVIVLVYEFIQFAGRDPLSWAVDGSIRPFSTIGQTTNLAEYLTVVAVGTAALAIFHGGLPSPARVFLILYSGLAAVGTVITQTRSAVLGIAAGGALLVALTWVAHPHPLARVISTVGVVGAGAVLAAVLVVTPLGARLLSTVEAPVATEGDSGLHFEGAADVRVALYRIAAGMVGDRPLLGYGPDNFLAVLPRYRSDTEPFEVQDNPTSSAHSWVAHVAVTSGVLGLAAFIGIAGLALVITFRSGFRPEAWAALAMLGAYLGAGLTTVNAIATDWLFWAAAGTIVSVASQQRVSPVAVTASPARRSSVSRRAAAAPAHSESGARSVMAYAFVGIGLVIALTSVSAMGASLSARTSQMARLQGRNQVAVDFGLRATRSDSLRPQYWDTLGLAYVSADRLADAVSAFERARSLAHYDVRYDGDLARTLVSLAQRGDASSAARAREVAERAIRTDPNNPRALQTRAVVMQVIGNLPEALSSSERALALDRLDPFGRTANADMYVTGIQVLASLG
ncbi:MAG: O-antigen ligase family protein, partial [Actinomycetota bacterium]|nr:O-antigen ligase family protein [Actinomycetota bacterium]